MNTLKNKAQRAAAAVAASALLAAGLLVADVAQAASSRAFDYKLEATVQAVRNDPNYKPIPLADKADNKWFFDMAQTLFAGDITKEQFVAEGAKKYPGYEASFQQFADRLTAH